MRKKKQTEFSDNEIEVLGKDYNKIYKRNKIILIVCTIVVVLVGLYFLVFVVLHNTFNADASIEEVEEFGIEENVIANNVNINEHAPAFVSISDTSIGIIQELDSEKVIVPIRIYTPYNTHIALIVGSDKIDPNDTNLIMVVQAANIRGDNQKILGDFVFKGELLSKGHSLLGYCAIVDDNIYMGKASQTAYLDSAITKKGYFFRQYPLVINGIPINNKPQHTNIRRALCQWNEKIVVIETIEPITLNNFGKILVNMGVVNAINIIGGSEAQGWAVTTYNEQMFIASKQRDYHANRSFIVFQKRN